MNVQQEWTCAVIGARFPIETRTVALLVASCATADGRAASLAAARAASKLRIPRWILNQQVEALRDLGYLEREQRPRRREDDHRLSFPVDR